MRDLLELDHLVGAARFRQCGGLLRFGAAMLSEPSLDLATPSQIGQVLGRDRSRVHKYRKLYQEGGAGALMVKRTGPRGPSKFKGTRLARAQKLLNERKSNRKVAELIDVSEHTIRRAIEDGRLVKPAIVSEPAAQTAASSPRQRSEEDASCAGGVAVKRNVDRASAQAGKLVEAAPEFVPAESVAKAGVLVALPALLGQGLLEVGEEVYGALRNGFFGLTSTLLSFGFMALIRIKSTERLTDQAPGEFGLVLGLDRAPEMKTARRKLAELGGRGLALTFSRAFTERWVEEKPTALGYLYIDGHVRPYHGGKHKLPKTHVQRRRLCMPATTDYWVNDANAEPLMFVTAPANEGPTSSRLTVACDRDMLRARRAYEDVRSMGKHEGGHEGRNRRGLHQRRFPWPRARSRWTRCRPT